MDEDMEMEVGATEGVAPAAPEQAPHIHGGQREATERSGEPPEASRAGQVAEEAARYAQGHPPAYPGFVAQSEQQQGISQVLSSAPQPPGPPASLELFSCYHVVFAASRASVLPPPGACALFVSFSLVTATCGAP